MFQRAYCKGLFLTSSDVPNSIRRDHRVIDSNNFMLRVTDTGGPESAGERIYTREEPNIKAKGVP